MPDQSNRVEKLRESDEKYPYHSKSRVLKYVKCPRQFEYSYLKGYKEPETYPMRRGTAIHETIEDYYHNVSHYVSTYVIPPTVGQLQQFLPDYKRWQPYVEPFISNFLRFEARRLEEASSIETWLPVEVEAEGWVEDPLDQGNDPIPAMGYVDVIYHADSIPGLLDTGKVIVDHKTGKTPDEQYRDDGIYLQGEFYTMLFGDEYNITAVAGYYPKNDDLIVSTPSRSRRSDLLQTMGDIETAIEEDHVYLETDEQPLCKWGEADDEECSYYRICSSSWGEPLRHGDTVRKMVANGCSHGEIAAHLNCSYDSVNYAKYKLGLS
ncbi:PD-(D/E)XK nuclease family protein [Halocatena halophila]|uniref:PD-(D/E)XK nuclease family protein n=1 Tax=Halocatena halophila TaxID=2814576 RepID=UPI002ED3F58A